MARRGWSRIPRPRFGRRGRVAEEAALAERLDEALSGLVGVVTPPPVAEVSELAPELAAARRLQDLPAPSAAPREPLVTLRAGLASRRARWGSERRQWAAVLLAGTALVVAVVSLGRGSGATRSEQALLRASQKSLQLYDQELKSLQLSLARRDPTEVSLQIRGAELAAEQVKSTTEALPDKVKAEALAAAAPKNQELAAAVAEARTLGVGPGSTTPETTTPPPPATTTVPTTTPPTVATTTTTRGHPTTTTTTPVPTITTGPPSSTTTTTTPASSSTTSTNSTSPTTRPGFAGTPSSTSTTTTPPG